MGLKRLKKENDFLNLSLIEIISSIDPSKTKKYTQFLVKMIKKDMKSRLGTQKYDELNPHWEKVSSKFDWEKNQMKSIITLQLLKHLFPYDGITNFVTFCEFSEKKMIDDNDISKYSTWEKIQSENYFAQNKEELKKCKKDIKIILDNEDYLILKPLSHLSSVKYGYNTKWCTAALNDPDYFYNHSYDGILIYVIDKITNKKFAFYRKGIFKNSGLQVYNSEDERIDSYQTGIPRDVLEILFKETDPIYNKNNFEYFNDDQKKKIANSRLLEEIPAPVIPINRHNTTFNYEDFLTQSTDNLLDELP